MFRDDKFAKAGKSMQGLVSDLEKAGSTKDTDDYGGGCIRCVPHKFPESHSADRYFVICLQLEWSGLLNLPIESGLRGRSTSAAPQRIGYSASGGRNTSAHHGCRQFLLTRSIRDRFLFRIPWS